ncbi:MAG: leucine-rich repeat protein [Eubacterium sp.]|nr:leucine-rich repeat protein [Eubacterium sp.]
MKKFASLILCFLMILSSLFVMPFSAFAGDEAQTLSNVPLSDWMSAIQGNTKLTEITIPGTHDTCAKEFRTSIPLIIRSVKCQKQTIPDLLNDGVRHLDIRCETDKSTHSTKTVHSATDCYLNGNIYYLDFVFQEVYNFLDAHPSETVILQMKEDDGNAGVDFTEAIYEYIHGYGQNKYFYGEDYDYHDYWYLGKTVPTLDEVRGKIVLFNRFNNDIEHSGSTVSEEESGQKVKWPDQTSTSYKAPVWEDYTDNNTGIGTIHVQDKFKYNSSDKMKAIKDTFALPHNKGEYYINFTSMNTGSEYPEAAANKINPQIQTLSLNKNKPSGVVPMDFVDEKVTRPLIECNEAVSKIVEGSDENISFKLNRETKTLTVSGSGEIKDYEIINDLGKDGSGSNAPWGNQITNSVYDYQFNSEIIENLVIENGITAIGENAFFDYNNLESIVIPHSVERIGENAFYQSDSSALNAVFNFAKNLDGNDYSKESFAFLSPILEECENIIEVGNYPQLLIDNACQALLNIIYDLVPYLDFNTECEGGYIQRNIDGNRLLFGTVIKLRAFPDKSHSFIGWFDIKTKRFISKSPELTFILSSDTELRAVFAKYGDSALVFKNESGWTQSFITKSCEEWAQLESISALLPPVPYQKGYKNGKWNYDEAEVLSKLANGENVEIFPEYEFEYEEEILIPVSEDIPVCELHFSEDEAENVGIFTLAAGIPETAQITEIGIIFKHSADENFNPNEYTLMLGNSSLVSKFFEKDESGIYVVDILHFSGYNWAARGYINYLDESGILKTAYSNQINISGQ